MLKGLEGEGAARDAEVRPCPTCIQLVTGLPQEMPVGHNTIVDNRVPPPLNPLTQISVMLIPVLSVVEASLDAETELPQVFLGLGAPNHKTNRCCSVATLN